MSKSDPWVTLVELLEELAVARPTFARWLAQGKGPRCVRLPNRQLRFKRSWVDSWLESLELAA